MARFETMAPSVPANATAPTLSERQAQAHMADWFIVLWFAGGLAGALIGLLLATLRDVNVDEWWRWGLAGALVGLLAPWLGAIVYALLRLRWAHGVWAAEVRQGRDITGDGIIGRPVDATRIIFSRNQQARVTDGEQTVGFAPAELREMIEVAYNVGHTVRCFDRRKLGSGRVLSKEDWTAFTSWLTRSGFLVGQREGVSGQLLGNADECLAAFQV